MFVSKILRARIRSAGVSTPKGADGTRAAPMRRPASSARNCSSFSRNSSGEGFKDTKCCKAALAFGALGIAARGSGVDCDVRRDHPYAAYQKYPVQVIVKRHGDVRSRYSVRIGEMKESIDLIEKLIAGMVDGQVKTEVKIEDGFALGAVESWRGEILCALEMKNGLIERCFPRDPSFCNWALFGIMGPTNIVPDFPLINKSLNLSYSGTDL